MDASCWANLTHYIFIWILLYVATISFLYLQESNQMDSSNLSDGIFMFMGFSMDFHKDSLPEKSKWSVVVKFQFLQHFI